MKYGFVYIWFDKKHKRYYIGSHWGPEDDGYICSSKWMKQAYSHRPCDFKRKILTRVYTNKKDLLIEENLWLSMIKPEEIKIRYYNLRTTEFGHWSADRDLETTTKQRISEKTKEAMQRPEARENYLKAIANRDNGSSRPEVRKKRSRSMIGKNVGKVCSEEQKQKLREINIGKKHSEETKRKLAAKSSFKILKCPHCGTEANVATLGRYHNDKCKVYLKGISPLYTHA